MKRKRAKDSDVWELRYEPCAVITWEERWWRFDIEIDTVKKNLTLGTPEFVVQRTPWGVFCAERGWQQAPSPRGNLFDSQEIAAEAGRTRCKEIYEYMKNPTHLLRVYAARPKPDVQA